MKPHPRLFALAAAAAFAFAVPGSLAAQKQSGGMPWLQGEFSDTLAAAGAAHKQVLVYFWMDGSEHCHNLWTQTLTQPEAMPELQQFICHGADARTAAGAGLVKRFGVTTLPTLLVVSADGTADDGMVGFVPLPTFTTELQRVLLGSGTVTSLRQAAAAIPHDLDARFRLGVKLGFVGDRAGSDKVFASIRTDDPEGATAPGAELLLFDVRQGILAAAKDQNDVATWNLQPMYDRLRKTRQPFVLWKGWNWVAGVEADRDPALQIAAWQQARPHAPPAQLEEWAGEVLNRLWQRRDALANRDRQLARDLAKVVEKSVDERPAGSTDNERQAFALGAAACGQAISGKRRKALALVERAKLLTPEDRHLDQLAEQLRK